MTAVAEPTTWVSVCALSAIARESGVAALVHGEAVAGFRDHLLPAQ